LHVFTYFLVICWSFRLMCFQLLGEVHKLSSMMWKHWSSDLQMQFQYESEMLLLVDWKIQKLHVLWLLRGTRGLAIRRVIILMQLVRKNVNEFNFCKIFWTIVTLLYTHLTNTNFNFMIYNHCNCIKLGITFSFKCYLRLLGITAKVSVVNYIKMIIIIISF
jgi:hypothetical protein